MKVYKYTLGNVPGTKHTPMPRSAVVVNVRVQHGNVVLWAVVDPVEVETMTRLFSLIETGAEVPTSGGAYYLGTSRLCEGNYILHTFETTV